MFATPTDAPSTTPAWVFESKWDSIPLVPSLARGRIALHSRTGIFRQLTASDALLGVRHDAVLDGELAALMPAVLPAFQLLQNAVPAWRDGALTARPRCAILSPCPLDAC